MVKNDPKLNLISGIVFLFVGLIMIFIPNQVYSLILTAALFLSIGYGVILIFRYFSAHNQGDLLFACLSLLFSIFLLRHQMLPQWIIRTAFGVYCLLSATACLIQLVINSLNMIQGKLFMLAMTLLYLILGLSLLLNPDFSTNLLMRCFGLYVCLLSFRFFHDGIEALSPLTKHTWKRKIRITLPALICAWIPDWALNAFNHYLESDSEVEYGTQKPKDPIELKVMVHVGPVGFQKVGHISLAFRDKVYSYGNYDSDSFRWNRTLGDGVFFTVPFTHYIQNAMEAEKNSIFEFGIYLNPDQSVLVQEELEKLESKAYRWYSKIEREDGYDHFSEFEEDYPSRLHYRTGAKFYKFKSGKFKTYWALGDNCGLFVDQILGVLGADVLSMRGILSPGTYLEWLQTEYVKQNSPVVSLNIHSVAK